MGRVGVFYSCKINTIVIDVSVSKKLFFLVKQPINIPIIIHHGCKI